MTRPRGAKPRVLYLPGKDHTEKVFQPRKYEEMLAQFRVWFSPSQKGASVEELLKQIASAEAVVTGWGTPQLTAEVLDRAGNLSLIAHSAGSVRWMIPDPLVEKYLLPRGITVFSANQAIACNVAESALGMMIACGRYLVDYALHCRQPGGWRSPELPTNPQGLHGSIVGVVSASKVGREMIKLLAPFDCTVLVYDPYLSDYGAGALGVEKTSLNELLKRSDYVTVHAPQLPETHHILRRPQLKLLKDGAVLVNTSRGSVIDEAALIKELKTGRIRAALDVTDPEPPAVDHPFRGMNNVMLLPHLSGAGTYGYFKIGETTLKALEDHFAGKPVMGAVDLRNIERIA
ncbi:MAG: hydroxyacid dehydrogenase [Armatimonadetes bacterium]|nr:hydroxyacid dehydrogenase [Armatimonadota bacterium]